MSAREAKNLAESAKRSTPEMSKAQLIEAVIKLAKAVERLQDDVDRLRSGGG